MRWIEHNGFGCPVAWETMVETEDPSGEMHIGRADDEMNVCEYGNSWIWEDEDCPADYEIVRYRVIEATEIVARHDAAFA